MMKKVFDVISREKALEPYKDLNDDDVISVRLIKKNIIELPPVTPSRRKGHSELKALIDKHRMYRLAYDELSEFERDVLELAEMENAE